MRSFDEVAVPVLRLGGIATRQQLRDAGESPNAIACAVRAGVLIRVRRAWFAVPTTEPDRINAVKLGGRLGAFSAAGSYGMWRGMDQDLHVSWSPHGNVAKPGRTQFGFPDAQRTVGTSRVISHWRVGGISDSPDLWRESVVQSLAQIFLHSDAVTAICSCDSALNKGLLNAAELRILFAQLPRRLSPYEHLVDGRADSGLETILRLWLKSVGLQVRSQVKIGRHRVDLLVGTSLIIETDGRDYHSNDARFNGDRIRTAELQALGYTIVRLSYLMVMFNFGLAEQAIREQLTRGRHLDQVAA
jgi:very-short-patch-repair endonuclease